MKTSFLRLKGSQQFRLRLLLSTVSVTPIVIEEIRVDDSSPGLKPHEVSFLRLIEEISDDCSVEINETGTKLRYKPGILVGGRNLVHECGLSRSIGYFLEPLIVLGLFGKKALSITLKGLELKIISRGSPPEGGGEVCLKVPIIQNSLSAVNLVDEGMVKRIRGIAYTTRVSPEMVHRMRYAARGILNRLLPDVNIRDGHLSAPLSGRSPGYGISLVAETTSGCFIFAEASACFSRDGDAEDMETSDEKLAPMLPEDIGIQAASLLLEEIKQGGVVDSTHQQGHFSYVGVFYFVLLVTWFVTQGLLKGHICTYNFGL
ncbi:probable RNA 3'-terminal phosphate cyclase-like protein isoform X5 [Amborella trichopoda]|uniref:probable RNA 3'-terminal phosphate cyclase-like protein isoform X5 n=1 Tax=Amborella trichopoda TaxID=13333 RepID=UPI0005D41C9D|nr:probable RNA 3'-terminal phosphate cyclase-like protein isoform X5 [Amborella trichopoda]|eukprot:XP_011629147.1 probable RNA 3'-terminal phosphate cyclase-like protein isoform X5 [Amborella trichopoda]